MLPALACCGIATVTAWVYLPNRATYLDVPGYHVSAALLVWALLAGPLIGLGAAAYIRLHRLAVPPPHHRHREPVRAAGRVRRPRA